MLMTILSERPVYAYSICQILDKLDRGVIMDEVFSLLCEIRLDDQLRASLSDLFLLIHVSVSDPG
jgi:hypothetical protein